MRTSENLNWCFREQRQLAVADGLYIIREPVSRYGDYVDSENEALRPNNAAPWQTNLEITEGKPGPVTTSDHRDSIRPFTCPTLDSPFPDRTASRPDGAARRTAPPDRWRKAAPYPAG
jgi:hypothetical protein